MTAWVFWAVSLIYAGAAAALVVVGDYGPACVCAGIAVMVFVGAVALAGPGWRL